MAVVGASITAVFPPLDVTVGCTVPLMEYVKVYGNTPLAPVNTICGAGVEFKHTAWVPEIVAVGIGFTVTVAVPVCSWEQAGVVVLETLTSS